MSLDVRLIDSSEKNELFEANITHNLTQMADEAGVYEAIWRPYRLKEVYEHIEFASYDEEVDFENQQTILASELINPLRNGLHELKIDPTKYRKFNPDNKWGSYEGLIKFIEKYLDACYHHPTSIVEVCR